MQSGEVKCAIDSCSHVFFLLYGSMVSASWPCCLPFVAVLCLCTVLQCLPITPVVVLMFMSCHTRLAVHVSTMYYGSQHAWYICREGSFTEEDAIAVGVAAGKELKEQAGDDFYDWARQNVY